MRLKFWGVMPRYAFRDFFRGRLYGLWSPPSPPPPPTWPALWWMTMEGDECVGYWTAPMDHLFIHRPKMWPLRSEFHTDTHNDQNSPCCEWSSSVRAMQLPMRIFNLREAVGSTTIEDAGATGGRSPAVRHSITEGDSVSTLGYSHDGVHGTVSSRWWPTLLWRCAIFLLHSVYND